MLTRQGEGSTADCDRYVRQVVYGPTVDLMYQLIKIKLVLFLDFF